MIRPSVLRAFFLALLLFSSVARAADDGAAFARAIRTCADAVALELEPPAAKRIGKAEAQIAAEEEEGPRRMSLALDCADAHTLPRPEWLEDRSILERELPADAWRAIADTVEGANRGGEIPPAPERTALLATLADVSPEPLPGVEERSIWRERLQAWFMRKLRDWFGPGTVIGEWLDSLTPDDLRSFSEGLLATVLVMFCLLMAGLGVLIYRALPRNRAARRKGPEVELPSGLEAVPLMPLEQIRALPADEQALALMRLVFARIEQDRLCTTRRSMTNREVARALRDAADLRIDAVARLADRCHFGGHSASEADLAPCFAEVDAIGARAA